MTKEQYLAIKKECRIRAVLISFLFVLGGVLFTVMLLNSSPYRSFFFTFGVTIVSANYASLVPMWQKKKTIEEAHPEWINLSTKGVKIPEKEALKRFVVFGGAFLVIVMTFVLRYKPVDNRPIPKVPQIYEKRNQDSSETGNGTSSSSDSEASVDDGLSTNILPDSSTLEEIKRKSLEDIRNSQNTGQQEQDKEVQEDE